MAYIDKKDKVLDLPMRKCFALQILKGEKVREYRLFTDHWATRMGEFNDPDDPDLMTDIKPFTRAHFHPYNRPIAELSRAEVHSILA